jgi:hypothetical protein
VLCAIGAGYCGSGSDNYFLRTRDAWSVARFRGSVYTTPGILQKSPQTIENKQREEAKEGKETSRGCKLLMSGHLPDPSEKTFFETQSEVDGRTRLILTGAENQRNWSEG